MSPAVFATVAGLTGAHVGLAGGCTGLLTAPRRADEVLEEGPCLDHGGAQVLRVRPAVAVLPGVRAGTGHRVHPPVAVHVVRVVHGQRVELLLVLPAVREAPGLGELGEQPVRLDDGLPGESTKRSWAAVQRSSYR